MIIINAQMLYWSLVGIHKVLHSTASNLHVLFVLTMKFSFRVWILEFN